MNTENKHYLYIGGILKDNKDNTDFLDNHVKVGVSQNYKKRYNFMGVANPYKFDYYDVYEINSTIEKEAKNLALYFEKKILELNDKNRHQNSEFLTFKDKNELEVFLENVYKLITDTEPFLKAEINIEHIEQEETNRSERIAAERKRFKEEFLNQIPSANKEILGLGCFSYNEELDISDDEKVHERFVCCWRANKERVRNCEYGVLFYDRKMVALFKIKGTTYNATNRRIRIESERDKSYDNKILNLEYDMFSAMPVMYF